MSGNLRTIRSLLEGEVQKWIVDEFIDELETDRAAQDPGTVVSYNAAYIAANGYLRSFAAKYGYDFRRSAIRKPLEESLVEYISNSPDPMPEEASYGSLAQVRAALEASGIEGESCETIIHYLEDDHLLHGMRPETMSSASAVKTVSWIRQLTGRSFGTLETVTLESEITRYLMSPVRTITP